MTYEQAISYLEQTKKFGWKPGLQTITKLMHELGDPQEQLKYVHIAGTNGKGSVAAFISSALRCAGYTTGLYISPHIQSFHERMSCNGVQITKEELAECTNLVRTAAENIVREGAQNPTEFELITAVGFLYFVKKKCDIVVLEVGLGGRLDATNVIQSPLVSVITNIGFDHTDYLGNTLSEIANEKAGIIKPRSEVVLYGQSSEVERVISERCAELQVPLTVADSSTARVVSGDVSHTIFDYGELKGLRLSLAGLYQVPNAVTAITALERLGTMGYNITDRALRDGLSEAENIGRFELMRREPTVVIDGAHNPQGVIALARALREIYPGRKISFIVGMLADKDYETSIREIAPLADHFAAIAPPSERAIASDVLAQRIKLLTGADVRSYTTPAEALEDEIAKAAKEDIICVLGSLYQIGEIRTYFGK